MSDWRIDHWDRLAEGDPEAAVLDPTDNLGHKNRYIAGIRNSTLHQSLARHAPFEVLLDFGCGSGSCSTLLECFATRNIGIDISAGLLRHANARSGLAHTLFVHYDGDRLPIAHGSIDAVTIYVVLSYVDDAKALQLLASLRKATREGGRLCMIEQTTRNERVSEGGLKHLRTTRRWVALMLSAGWHVEGHRHIRFGRFPTTPLIRWGLIPRMLHAPLAMSEAWLGRRLGPMPWDYAETLFEARK